MLKPEEIQYLRELGKRVNELSQNPIWAEKTRLWERKNALIKTRPLILCMLPEEAWPELIPPERLRLSEPFWRGIEWDLLQRMYRYENIHDDLVLDNKLYIPIRYTFSDWFENRKRPYAGDGKRAERFYPCIEEYGDLAKLKKPMLTDIDREATRRQAEQAHEVFGDALQVVEGEPFYAGTDGYVKGWGLSAIDLLCELRGLGNVLYDLADEPDFVHDAMGFLTDGLNGYLDQMEENALLFPNNNAYNKYSNTPLGSNGLACLANTPEKGKTSATAHLGDLWGYCMAQEFALVSPGMTDEFVYQYQKKIAPRFGMISYGCCEPNDKKWELLKAHFPNLRALSVSHASDLAIAAQAIGDRYVLSWKPHSMLIEPMDEKRLREELSRAFALTKNCHVVCSMRDNLTLYGEPERAGKWVAAAMDAAAVYEI